MPRRVAAARRRRRATLAGPARAIRVSVPSPPSRRPRPPPARPRSRPGGCRRRSAPATVPVAASIRVTVFAARFATQTEPPPVVIAAGSSPTADPRREHAAARGVDPRDLVVVEPGDPDRAVAGGDRVGMDRDPDRAADARAARVDARDRVRCRCSRSRRCRRRRRARRGRRRRRGPAGRRPARCGRRSPRRCCPRCWRPRRGRADRHRQRLEADRDERREHHRGALADPRDGVGRARGDERGRRREHDRARVAADMDRRADGAPAARVVARDGVARRVRHPDSPVGVGDRARRAAHPEDPCRRRA